MQLCFQVRNSFVPIRPSAAVPLRPCTLLVTMPRSANTRGASSRSTFTVPRTLCFTSCFSWSASTESVARQWPQKTRRDEKVRVNGVVSCGENFVGHLSFLWANPSAQNISSRPQFCGMGCRPSPSHTRSTWLNLAGCARRKVLQAFVSFSHALCRIQP